jgi:D-alanyl-D-alanine carboxypeptidase
LARRHHALTIFSAVPPRFRRPAVALLAATALVAVAAPGAQAAATKPLPAATRAKLEQALTATMATIKAPGVIAGVWIGNRGWTAVRGTTSRKHGTRPSLAIHTRIGSITKTLTGTLILQLVDQHRLSLDDTIDRWFPTVPNAKNITVRDLGNMSSGIASYTLEDSITNRYFADPDQVWNQSALITAGADLPRAFPPRQGFLYSNTNFLMLGRIVELVTKQPLGKVMRDRIFRPLGMSHSYFPSNRGLPSPRWQGYTEQGAAPGTLRNATFWSPTFAGAAGQVISTLGDLRIWTKALGTGSLLTRATQRIRLVPNPTMKPPRTYDFALGTDHGWLSHSGELPGYNTQVAYLPKLRASVVVLADADIAGASGANPAPAVLTAIAKVISPQNVPGT